MNTNITAAVLHLREAARLLQGVHLELSLTLMKVANAFVQSDEDAEKVAEMKHAADAMSESADGTAG